MGREAHGLCGLALVITQRHSAMSYSSRTLQCFSQVQEQRKQTPSHGKEWRDSGIARGTGNAAEAVFGAMHSATSSRPCWAAWDPAFPRGLVCLLASSLLRMESASFSPLLALEP